MSILETQNPRERHTFRDITKRVFVHKLKDWLRAYLERHALHQQLSHLSPRMRQDAGIDELEIEQREIATRPLIR